MTLRLDAADRDMLGGGRGEGVALAMRVVTRAAEAMGAAHLLDISSAHVDGCLYLGRVGLDFARALVDGEASTVVPTTLNVGSLDLLHPDMVRVDDRLRAESRALMDAYVSLGCRPTWTCAPYQLTQRPGVGDQIAWAESNAIVFANSVLGARTERYGDFIDISAAVTGRVPAYGLHLDQGRLPTLVVAASMVSAWLEDDAGYALLGVVLGRVAGSQVVALTGLPTSTTEDQLKALGAAAASSGALAMFHVTGLTPEAPTEAELAGMGLGVIEVDPAMLADAQRSLITTGSDVVDAVSLGTPHYSIGQIGRLVTLLAGRRCQIPLYVNTSRHQLGDVPESQLAALEMSGVRIVTDTCTYITPILAPDVGVVMTDSAKWAFYAPANLGVDVVFGSTTSCVETATTGRLQDPAGS